jgi:hypothetical protein
MSDADFEFSQCCFCQETYLSEACRDCPARDYLMPDELDEMEEIAD